MLDTNVVLDVLLRRPPEHAAAAKLLHACETGRIMGHLGATTVTTLFYLVAKASDKATAAAIVEKLLRICTVAEVDGAVLRAALTTGFADFEDAVLHEAAAQAGCDGIVTRDATGFRKAKLRTYSPAEICALMSL